MELFNVKIDLENGLIEGNEYKTDKNGYRRCWVKDRFGNIYQIVSDVIMAEGLQLPKHLWKKDENGRTYEVDHIKPVSKGGTDAFNNLRLVSHRDNCNNNETRETISRVLKGKYSKEVHHMTGRKMLEETKAKKSSSMIDKLKNDSRISKTVGQYTIEGELIKTYPSTMEVQRQLGFNRGAISSCCRNSYYGGNVYKNYVWKYE